MNNFKKHAKTYRSQAIVQDYLRKAIIKRCYSSARVLEIGANQGELARMYAKRFKYEQYLAVDINEMSDFFDKRFSFLQADGNDLSALPECDLLLSNACFQWLDLEQTLANLPLKKGGEMIITSFLPNNCKQLKRAFNVGLDYLNLAQIRKAFEQADYLILESAPRTYHLRFSSAIELLRHIKHSGAQLEQASYINKSQLAKLGKLLTYKSVLIRARKL